MKPEKQPEIAESDRDGYEEEQDKRYRLTKKGQRLFLTEAED